MREKERALHVELAARSDDISINHKSRRDFLD